MDWKTYPIWKLRKCTEASKSFHFCFIKNFGLESCIPLLELNSQFQLNWTESQGTERKVKTKWKTEFTQQENQFWGNQEIIWSQEPKETGNLLTLAASSGGRQGPAAAPVELVPFPSPASPTQASHSASPFSAQPWLLAEGRLLPQARVWQ